MTKHLQQGIESDHFRVKKPMPKVGGFRSFSTARRSIQGFEAMLWLRKGFGFTGAWTVIEQNRMLGCGFRCDVGRHSDHHPATYSELKPATIPINHRPL